MTTRSALPACSRSPAPSPPGRGPSAPCSSPPGPPRSAACSAPNMTRRTRSTRPRRWSRTSPSTRCRAAGPARDVILIGQGQSDLEDLMARMAARPGPDRHARRPAAARPVLPRRPFPVAKRGVPVLLLMALGGGADLVNGGREAGDRWVSDFTAHCYHQTCDEWSPDLGPARRRPGRQPRLPDRPRAGEQPRLAAMAPEARSSARSGSGRRRSGASGPPAPALRPWWRGRSAARAVRSRPSARSAA